MVASHPWSGSKGVTPIRILVADRDPMTSQLLAESLGRDPNFKIVAIASAPEILPLAVQQPDIALISMEFDAASKKGLRIARTLHTSHPNIRIVILLEVSTRESVIGSFHCGASGVFCRNQPVCELRSCIERVSQGEVWARGEEAQYVLEAIRRTPSCDGIDDGKVGLLSKRELQVAEHAAQGHTNKQIADDLKLSEYTVKNYLSRVFEKLGVSSRFELLFLLFNERRSPLISRAAEFDVAGVNQPIETYVKAAEEGFIAAQYLVGLAHLQGSGVEKNGRAAYYWLRMVEENSHELQQRTRTLTQELKSKMRTDELETLEHSIAAAAQRNKLLTTKQTSGFVKRSAASASFGRIA